MEGDQGTNQDGWPPADTKNDLSFVTSQGTVQGLGALQLTGEGQIHQLMAGAGFHPVYQTPADQGAGRVSPDYNTGSSPNSDVLQQQLQALQQSADLQGLHRPQIVTVPLFMSALGPNGVQLPPVSLHGGSLSSALTTPIDIRSITNANLANPVTMATASSLISEHPHLREQVVAQGDTMVLTSAAGGDQSVAQQHASIMQPLFTVVNESYDQGAHPSSAHNVQLLQRDADGNLSLTLQTNDSRKPITGHYSGEHDHSHAETSFHHVNEDSNQDFPDMDTPMGESSLIGPPDGAIDSTVTDASEQNEADLVQMLDCADQAAAIQGIMHIQPGPEASGEEDEEEDGVDEDGDDESLMSNEGRDKENEIPLTPVRKSTRIAQQTTMPTPVHRPCYQPTGFYSTQDLWCEDCQTSYSQECLRHKMQFIQDKVVLSRAWASLPNQLQIFRLDQSNDIGVFSKKAIPKRTQFGPFVAETVTTKDQVTNTRLPLRVEREEGLPLYIEANDESKCNWMMFVRPAENYSEQNLIIYQHGNDLFFCTIKQIEPSQELKVWYAAHYAERLGLQTHLLSSSDIEAMDEADLRWPCYECNKKYRTSAQLQKHLLTHDDNLVNARHRATVTEEEEAGPKGGGAKHRRRRGARGRMVKRKAQSPSQAEQKDRPKKIRELMGDEGATFQSWKKKKTNLYLSKLKKYKEPLKRSLRTLYRKELGNDWVCMHCHLTFDNPSLLNLHTLTHAAEDVGGMDDRGQQLPLLSHAPSTAAGLVGGAVMGDETAEGGDRFLPSNNLEGINIGAPQGIVQLDENNLQCPVCTKQFELKQELIEHAASHAKGRRRMRLLVNPHKPHKCECCWKSFTTEERLQRHLLCHGDESSKPLQCQHCAKRFMNNSALACHLKTHSQLKYYDCPICKIGFDQVHEMKEHTQQHANINGIFECPCCHKAFTDFQVVRKHMRAFHSERSYACPDCDKMFPRPDKLKLHALKHTAHREFMCDLCGRQFKRRDKLKEHQKRMHGPDRDQRVAERAAQLHEKQSQRKFIPKVSPTDYNRFIYKCHQCLLGFKRRGMLVNHLAKRHPNIKAQSVPELNLPILKTQRDYFCQYCNKVYRSSSKRKAHIIKNHPGLDLPASARRKEFTDTLALPNPTFSQPAGSVTTMPHPCEFCHKQYASKAKLLQHQRKKHPGALPSRTQRRKASMGLAQMANQVSPRSVIAAVIQREPLEATDVIMCTAPHSDTTDLLTQAMSELTQGLTDFHRQPPTEYQMAPRVTFTAGGAATIAVQQANGAANQHTTIDLAHLGQTLASQFQLQPQPQQQQQPATLTNTLPTSPAVSLISPQVGQSLSPQTVTVVTSTAGGQVLGNNVPLSVAPVYLQRTWSSPNNYNSVR